MSTKEKIFEYVTNSPENTNPAVLRSLLNSLDGGGGSNAPFVVTITATRESVTADKTYAEIAAALEDNQRILLNWINSNSGYAFTSANNISLSFTTDNPNCFRFYVCYPGDGELTVISFDIYEYDSISVNEERISNY